MLRLLLFVWLMVGIVLAEEKPLSPLDAFNKSFNALKAGVPGVPGPGRAEPAVKELAALVARMTDSDRLTLAFSDTHCFPFPRTSSHPKSALDCGHSSW